MVCGERLRRYQREWKFLFNCTTRNHLIIFMLGFMTHSANTAHRKRLLRTEHRKQICGSALDDDDDTTHSERRKLITDNTLKVHTKILFSFPSLQLRLWIFLSAALKLFSPVFYIFFGVVGPRSVFFVLFWTHSRKNISSFFRFVDSTMFIVSFFVFSIFKNSRWKRNIYSH